ncbi:MAG: TSUP family transporter [Archangium sp.]|nr:TSUP family transporter [Archangium sp.]
MVVAGVAGFIDAIAGGGGLLTVPALLNTGLPIHTVFGTNKGASVFGAATALYRYWRAGAVDLQRARVLLVGGFLGSLAGAGAMTFVDPAVLRPLVLVLLVVAGVVVVFIRRPTAVQSAVAHAAGKAAGIALLLGAYDGFFGPGTGTFLFVAMTLVLRLDATSATGHAKVVNFASNAAAVVVLAAAGRVAWAISLPMALGQFIGASLGARVALRHGERLIRLVVLAVVIALVAKLATDLLASSR